MERITIEVKIKPGLVRCTGLHYDAELDDYWLAMAEIEHDGGDEHTIHLGYCPESLIISTLNHELLHIVLYDMGDDEGFWAEEMLDRFDLDEGPHDSGGRRCSTHLHLKYDQFGVPRLNRKLHGRRSIRSVLKSNV